MDPHVDASNMTPCSSNVVALPASGIGSNNSCGDFSSSTENHDSIYVSDPLATEESDEPFATVFPPEQVRLVGSALNICWDLQGLRGGACR